MLSIPKFETRCLKSTTKKDIHVYCCPHLMSCERCWLVPHSTPRSESSSYPLHWEQTLENSLLLRGRYSIPLARTIAQACRWCACLRLWFSIAVCSKNRHFKHVYLGFVNVFLFIWTSPHDQKTMQSELPYYPCRHIKIALKIPPQQNAVKLTFSRSMWG
jgi:hypothetical protein